MIENQIINKAIDYIFQHIDEDLSVESIAAFCGYSKFYLSRLFKAETGEGIYTFIKRAKFYKAGENRRECVATQSRAETQHYRNRW